ncbi:ABC transporter substrate-binding protein [Heyndrickxia ginsengihumi]|uniref:ABC transporter substrate-binding protein n=2 Tax=Heyndrickxia ginsengihumi TaxID=363870 RepID=A0A0A6VA25_9BACI|nr:extracellular solute-binding protein [Heyndrickxia ginsengihumi]KHD84421.1 ABC transporter substrate-binding protein [Heyndrickxia ginsengihumi]
MKHIKKAFVLMFVLAFVLSLTACGSSKQTSGTSKDGTITLTFWNGFTASDGEILQGIVNRFNKTNDQHIKIKMDVMTWANFNEKLPPAISSKTAPDFVLMNYGDFASYVANGAVQPLDDFWKYKGVNKSDFSQTALKLGKIDGKQYFIPMQVQGMYLYWNKDLFKKAGLDPNKPPRTWDELVTMAKKLTDPSKKVYGFAFPTDGNAILYNWMLANKGSLTNSNYSKSTFNSKANLEVLNTIQKLVYKDKSSPQSISGAEADNLMNSGQLAMYMNGPWLNNGLKKNEINYGVTTIPEGKAGKTAILDGVGFAIPSSTDESKKEAIYEFIKYWNTTKIGKEWSTKNGFPPYLKSVSNDPEIKKNHIVSELGKQVKYAKPFMSGSTKTATINNDIINPLLEKLFSGADPKKLLKDADKNINEKLSEN